MIDLNDVRVFDVVADLGSFSAAARLLGQPKSTVSRSVARLEKVIGIALFARTTRRVELTAAGIATHTRLKSSLPGLMEAVKEMGSFRGRPHGVLRIRAGIGFGINVLANYLPAFLAKYPAIDVSLDLTSKLGNPINDHFDVGIQIGPLPDSALSGVVLGQMQRCLCAAPAYLKRCGRPKTIADISKHDTIEMPRGDGRPRTWTFKRGEVAETIELKPRVCVNEAITILRLVQSGAGLGIVSKYLCRADITEGRLIRLFADWKLPPVDVSLVHLPGRELSPAIRVFLDYIKMVSATEKLWRDADC